MKVFWSWQSDLPGKTNRHFVRNCLRAAIDELKSNGTMEEPTERDRTQNLHLDHDRQNVSGSPDLARTILTKIEESAVFVGDVSAVGLVYASSAFTKDKPTTNPKKLINSNVAIELGYALHALGDARLLMVANAHYGSQDDLPFDLRHKAGPIFYELPPDANKAMIEQTTRALTTDFKRALKPYLSGPTSSEAQRSRETSPNEMTGLFFDPGEAIASLGVAEDGDKIDYYFSSDKFCSLRVIPHRSLEKPMTKKQLTELAERTNIPPFARKEKSSYVRPNRYGAIVFDPEDPSNSELKQCTQLLSNGEIWALNNKCFHHYNGKDVIPVEWVEQTLQRSLPAYLKCIKSTDLGSYPVSLRFEATGLQSYYLAKQVFGGIQTWSILDPKIELSIEVADIANLELETIKNTILDKFFETTGYDRPK